LENFESSLAKAGFMVRLEKNMLIHLGNLTHGSVYDYDRKIPLIFLGKGMRKGVSSKEVRSIDIAPSLAHMAGIKYPSSVDGNNLFDDEFLSH
jgi:arylsulfatase A-like enzyme